MSSTGAPPFKTRLMRAIRNELLLLAVVALMLALASTLPPPIRDAIYNFPKTLSTMLGELLP